MAQQEQPETGGTGLGHRSVSLTRLEHGSYLATNERGGTLRFGGGGESPDFTPVELFLTAMAGCSAIDVDFITSRIAEPVRFDVTSEGEKMRDGVENHLGDIDPAYRRRFQFHLELETPPQKVRVRDRRCRPGCAGSQAAARLRPERRHSAARSRPSRCCRPAARRVPS